MGEITFVSFLAKVLLVSCLVLLFLGLLYLGSRLVGAGWFRSKREFYERHFPGFRKEKRKGDL